MDPLSDQGRSAELDIAEMLREEIISGRIAPGVPLRQSVLGRRFGVSRTPVREALHKLAAWGLVDLIINRRAVVRRISRRDYAAAFVVRAELEALAAELAAARPEAVTAPLAQAVAQEHRVVEAVAECRGRRRDTHKWPERWVAADEAFHGAILDVAGSPRLRENIEATSALFPRGAHWDALRGRPYPLRKAAEEHAAVLACCKRGKRRGAADAMRIHILNFGDAFLDWWDGLNPPEQTA